MMVLSLSLSSLSVILGQSFVLAQNGITANLDTSLTLMYQNNLNASDDVNHLAFILVDPNTIQQQVQICANLGQHLAAQSNAANYNDDLAQLLSYRSYAGYDTSEQTYLVDNGMISVPPNGSLILNNHELEEQLPAICSSSAEQSEPQNSTATSSTVLSILGGNNTYQGYFNKKSFRFLGIRYATQPERFELSQVYDAQGEIIDATEYGSECVQAGAGKEDCLFLNIQTPYIPKVGSLNQLRPVMFWIHGGKPIFVFFGSYLRANMNLQEASRVAPGLIHSVMGRIWLHEKT